MHGRCLFVYFRVAREHEAAAVSALRRMQAQWAGSMHSELLRRADDHADTVTLMEIYRQAGGVSAETQQRIAHEAASCLRPWLIGERHVEVFEPCA